MTKTAEDEVVRKKYKELRFGSRMDISDIRWALKRAIERVTLMSEAARAKPHPGELASLIAEMTSYRMLLTRVDEEFPEGKDG